jgi:MFS family permease
MTSYALMTLKMDATVSFMATLTIGIGRVVASLFGGHLADRVGRKPIMILSQVALVAAAYPAFLLLSSHKTLAALVIASGTLSVLTSLGGAVGLTLIPESFPASVRSAGLSIAYATAVTVFGGSAQVIVTWLIFATGNPLSPAWYLMASSLVGIGAMFLMQETKKRRLN